MSISWDKRNKRWRYTFNRVIAGKRNRASRLLPKGWTQAEADTYDRTESARLYAIATGVERPDELIETAVLLYLRDKTHLKSHRAAQEHLNAIMWAYAGQPLSKLAEVARDVNANRTSVRKGQVLSDATVHNRLALLKAACRWAWKKHGLCEHDPTGRMQLPTVNNEQQVYMTRPQMLAICRKAKRRDVRALVRIAFYTGMRLGEILRVEVLGGAFYLADTKNGTRRAIPIHRKLLTCLRYLPLTAPKITLQRAYVSARRRAGVTGVTFHTLRHSAASEMVNAGVDLFTVATVLGHKDTRSSKRYSHLNVDRLSDAIGKIGQKSAHIGPDADKKKAA